MVNDKIEILVIDDDFDILELIQLILKRGGYSSIGLRNTKNIDSLLSKKSFSLMIVDRNLPCVEGTEFVQQLREKGDKTPVIFLTAKDTQQEKIEGFMRGGDDYITKPFDNDELLLRIKALLRRTHNGNFNNRLIYRDIVMDLDSFQVTIDGTIIKLTKLEFKLLQTFLENIDHVLERDYLLDIVWNCSAFDEHCSEKSVNVAIKRLKSKIDKDGNKNYIESIRGIGYKFV